ncbi:MAG: PilZ domain-containing protein [Oligoflexia bacterium]|nr:PilZ domain-containing protein [Oligoflexia bacterium]
MNDKRDLKDKFTVLLMSKERQDQEMIQKEISQSGGVYELTENWEAAFNRIQSGGIDSVVANLFIFDGDAFNRINHLKVVAPTLTPTIVSATNMSITRDQLKKAGKIVVLDKPLKVGAIESIVSRLKSGEQVSLRDEARFVARQFLVMEKLPAGQTQKALILNISKQGACVEFKGAALKAGEVLRMTIPLDVVGRTHTVYGKVVWTKDGSGIQSIGLIFVSEEIAFNLILEKATA